MRLLITTPTSVVVERDDVISVRAEDESGDFGVLSGHADFLTVLTVSIVRWRERGGASGYCAVRRGVFTTTGGANVMIATREAIVSDDFEQLANVVLAHFKMAAKEEESARLESERLQMLAIRRIMQYLRPNGAHHIDYPR
ncbi:MAG: F0F1 ATP synthase subunit epsilon [Alphaproteobacteria bacterium]|nr:F0F1 ATP synthase subunit epsilon [Alphaproteobacteria bacterium]